MEYESFDAIDVAQTKMSELLKEKNPDDYQEINQKMRSLISGHTDAIVREAVGFRK